MTKYHLRNEPLLHELIDFLMDNVGNVTSVRTIADTLASGKKKADHKTIGKYIDALCKAFAFYRIRRYDIRGKRYLRSEDKYYLADHSFRFARLGTRNMDYGRVLENIVAVELLRRGYEVYVGVLYQKEIDPLLKIRDAYPKLLIARIWQPIWQHEGIKIIDAAEWLAEAVPQSEEN